MISNLRGIFPPVASTRPSLTQMIRLCSIAAVSIVASAFTAQASPIVYDINDIVGAGTVTGTITTDGTLGTLQTSDITGWNLVLDNGFGTILDLTGPSVVAPIEGVEVAGSDLTASAGALSFNFSATDGGFFLIQQNGLANGGTYYCEGAIGQANCIAGGESDFPSGAFAPNQQFAPRSGTVTLGSASSAPSGVPEPSTVPLLIVALGSMFLGKKLIGLLRTSATQTS